MAINPLDVLPPQFRPWDIPVPGGGRAGDVIGKADDVLAKDDRVPLSKLIQENTGWRGQSAKTAMAVAGGESSYDPNAENACCVGLLQMNVDVHQGKFGIPVGRDKAVKWLKIPANNLSAAYKLWVSVGGSWNPWEAYTNGSWRKFWGKDPLITVSDNSLSDPITDAAGNIADAALGPLDEIASAILSPSTWFRVGKGALGGTLLIIGVTAFVFVVASKTNAAKNIAEVADIAL